jgi:hypothetical protein
MTVLLPVICESGFIRTHGYTHASVPDNGKEIAVIWLVITGQLTVNDQ